MFQKICIDNSCFSQKHECPKYPGRAGTVLIDQNFDCTLFSRFWVGNLEVEAAGQSVLARIHKSALRQLVKLRQRYLRLHVPSVTLPFRFDPC
jgi:hypothetical protein